MPFRVRLPAVALLLFPLLTGAGEVAQPLSLIPLPQQVGRSEGSFAPTPSSTIGCAMPDAACAWTVDYVASLIAKTRGVVLPRSGSLAIVLRRDSTIESPEGYRLRVTPAGVEIAARTDAGLLYGAVTLWQLTSQQAGATRTIEIPAVTISDAPRFSWRGILLDSARHYQSPAFIKSFIDSMALHKLNVLQWHLADDQAWRLEIKKYPRLTKIAAWRTNAREGRYGGFYTQDQVREIVAYARQRNVTIVPEIEMPGHARAAIVAYPRLGSAPHPPKSMSGYWGVFPHLYNIDNSTFAFLEDVLTEVMDLFPSPYIHIGGDEAPKDQWNASPKIQRQMHELGVKDTSALQGYFVERIGRFLEAHHRRLIGWDEILESHPAPSAAVMSWRTVESAGEAAREGHDVVLSPAPTLYLDYCQALRAGEPTCRGPQVPLKEVYDFNLKPEGALAQHLIGAQGNIWSEHMPTGASISYAAFPRAAALAEITWSSARDWNGFLERLPAQFARYRALAIPYAESAFTVDVKALPSPPGAQVSLSNQTGFGTIRYTLDGSAPTVSSKVYAAPFDVAMPVTVTAAPFDGSTSLAKPAAKTLDPRALSRRDSYTMDQCSNDLPLAQRTGHTVMMVNVMNPCWIYRGLETAAITGMDISVAKLPFDYEIGKDQQKIPLYPKALPQGQLELHLDSCSGDLLSVLPLPAKAAGFSTLHAAFAPRAGVHDVCLLFARRQVDPVWSIDWVQPLRKE